MSDGHPRIYCCGLPGEPCDRWINVHRDYRLPSGRYRCTDCEENRIRRNLREDREVEAQKRDVERHFYEIGIQE